ncbi:MAG: flagellar export chaperone FliS [Betaproteobacteria bacterium]|nr:flagellar export chaperone FliS [Betaproteobacteria bacterium]
MRAARAYGKTDRQTAVMVSSSVGLVILLYDRLLLRLAEAKRCLVTRDIPARSEAISKSIELIEIGLISSLDVRQGGDIAARLKIHYDVWIAKLFNANMKASVELLDEVEQEVQTIRSAFSQIEQANDK